MGEDRRGKKRLENGGTDQSPGVQGDAEQAGPGEEDLLDEFGFSTFILSLSTSALVYLGELPDLSSNAMEVNLPVAKQTISLIEMLRRKTRGNLSADEEKLVENILYDLRVKYVKASGK